MPRLTDRDYLRNHALIHSRNLADRATLGLLAPNEQWDPITFYLAQVCSTSAERLHHRVRLSRADTSLPQRAGRAYSKLLRMKTGPVLVRETPFRIGSKRKKGAKYEVRILSEVNPSLDPAEMARILVRAMQERDKH
jgi:hypothetical protein